MTRTPAEILESLDAALRATSDTDPLEPISEIVDDVLDSVAVALDAAGIAEAVANDIVATARDYFANHYC